MNVLDVVNYLNHHRDALWYAIGFTLLALEAGVFGFAVGMFLFTGLGALATGLLIATGLLSGSATSAIATFAITSLVSATLLWKLFHRRQQTANAPPRQVSDIIGLRFVLQQDVGPETRTVERYSGVDWQVVPELAAGSATIPRGTLVEVVSLDAGIFRVRPVTSP
ncbi:MAG: NfeD family protein [Magnetococcales bacterium]|nr:NfeD family protein [Magnetococcales bacterium]